MVTFIFPVFCSTVYFKLSASWRQKFVDIGAREDRRRDELILSSTVWGTYDIEGGYGGSCGM